MKSIIGLVDMFYTVRFNAAFAALGINPTIIPANLRELGQSRGKAAGCSPQEAVLVILSELPLEIKMMADLRAVYVWVREGKVRADNPIIQGVALNIGLELPRN
ncbi:hypothetical protein FY150_19765 [Agrobacterium tumefaciens]|nr:hypothetical protein FY150_19765 [Agrobacterium tumefaciens]